MRRANYSRDRRIRISGSKKRYNYKKKKNWRVTRFCEIDCDHPGGHPSEVPINGIKRPALENRSTDFSVRTILI